MMLPADKPLLTIAIPTFNRLECLKLLAEFLCAEIDENTSLGEMIEVLIADNCSTDGTTAYINALNRPYLVAHTHEANLGADYNVRYCFKQARGQYVWIIGDDDLPKIRTVNGIIETLIRYQPNLLYLESRWITGPLDVFKLESLHCPVSKTVRADSFAYSVGTFVTFLSGMVVNKAIYQKVCGEYILSKYAETSLPQLEWILSLLSIQGRFVIMGNTPLLARAGNTGGYKLLEVFAVNYPKIVREIMGMDNDLAKILMHRHVLGYLPGLIWSSRFSFVGIFDDRINLNEIKSELAGSLFFWLFVVPIIKLPKYSAFLFLKVSQLLSKFSVIFGIYRTSNN